VPRYDASSDDIRPVLVAGAALVIDHGMSQI